MFFVIDLNGYIYICAFAFYDLVISLVCDITSYVMNVHLELLLYSFSVVVGGIS